MDKEDVHLSVLKHKFTRNRVRVRRDFRGAKIIDLERKSFIPIKFQEPEPNSLQSSDSESFSFKS